MTKKTKIVSYTVDDKEYKLEFRMLSPSKSLSLLMYLGKIIGGSAGKALGALDISGGSLKDLANIKEDDLNLEKLGDVIFGLFGRLDDEEVIKKINLLFSSVNIEGEGLDLDHFMFDGRPDLIFKVAGKALGVNYKRFLGESSGVFSKIQETIGILKNGISLPKEQM